MFTMLNSGKAKPQNDMAAKAVTHNVTRKAQWTHTQHTD